jgi:hypothetical protein
VCLPVLGRQIPAGGDTMLYAPRLVEFHENLIHGVFLPRWAPDLGNGHGQPLFLFVPPLVYYFGEVWRLTGLDAAKALDAVAASAVFVAAVSMFLLGRLLWDKWAGWLAAAAYLYAPYLHVNLYVLHHLAEFVAFAFYPIAIYGLAVFARSRDVRYLGLAVLGHAAVMLTHNGAALMFTPVLVAFLFFQSWQFRSLKLLSWQTASLALSLTLTAFQWIPSLLEKGYVHLDRTITDYFDYKAHFVYPWQLFSSRWGYRGSDWGDTDGMSFSLGWSHVLLAGIAVFLALRRSRDGRTTLFFAVMAILASYMTLLKSSEVPPVSMEISCDLGIHAGPGRRISGFDVYRIAMASPSHFRCCDAFVDCSESASHRARVLHGMEPIRLVIGRTCPSGNRDDNKCGVRTHLGSEDSFLFERETAVRIRQRRDRRHGVCSDDMAREDTRAHGYGYRSRSFLFPGMDVNRGWKGSADPLGVARRPYSVQPPCRTPRSRIEVQEHDNSACLFAAQPRRSFCCSSSLAHRL